MSSRYKYIVTNLKKKIDRTTVVVPTTPKKLEVRTSYEDNIEFFKPVRNDKPRPVFDNVHHYNEKTGFESAITSKVTDTRQLLNTTLPPRTYDIFDPSATTKLNDSVTLTDGTPTELNVLPTDNESVQLIVDTSKAYSIRNQFLLLLLTCVLSFVPPI